jgi:hypothetical protein
MAYDLKISLLASEFGHMLLKTIKAIERAICFNKLAFAIDHQSGSKGWFLYSFYIAVFSRYDRNSEKKTADDVFQ